MCPDERDFASLQEFREIVESPDDISVTLATFLALKERLTEFVLRLRQDYEASLRVFLQDKTGFTLSNDVDVFRLAITAAIKHTTFPHGFFYDIQERDRDYLYGGCNKFAAPWEDKTACSMDYDDIATFVLNHHPWSSHHYDIGVELIKYIIRCLGEDPVNATAAVMDNKDSRLCCRLPECDSTVTRVVLSWRAAVSSALLTRHKIEPPFLPSYSFDISCRSIVTLSGQRKILQGSLHNWIRKKPGKLPLWKLAREKHSVRVGACSNIVCIALRVCGATGILSLFAYTCKNGKIHLPGTIQCLIVILARHGMLDEPVELRDFYVHDSATFPTCDFVLISDKAPEEQRNKAIESIALAYNHRSSIDAFCPAVNYVVGRFSTNPRKSKLR